MVEPVVNNSLQFAAYMELASAIYSPEFVAELETHYEIENEKQLRARLIFLAAKYFEQKAFQNIAPSEKLMREEIQEIKKSADDLNSKFNSLTGPASELFWRPQRQLLVADLYFSEAKETVFGHDINRRTNTFGAVSIETLKEAQILEAIKIVSNLAQHAAGRLEINKGGAPSDLVLRDWVINGHCMFI